MTYGKLRRICQKNIEEADWRSSFDERFNSRAGLGLERDPHYTDEIIPTKPRNRYRSPVPTKVR